MFLIRIGHKLIKPLLVIGCLLLISVLQLGFIILIIALLPSILMYHFDNSPERTNSKTIFACNLAGAIPFFIPIFVAGLKFKKHDILSVLENINLWIYSYGFAIGGLATILLSNQIAHFIVTIKHKLQITMLNYSQEKLLEEWGEPVRRLTDRRDTNEEKE